MPNPGISYTTFNLSQVAHPKVVPFAANGTFTVTATLRNTGRVAGAATIFATYSKQTDGVVRWAQMLCGFAKLEVGAGGSGAPLAVCYCVTGISML